MYDVCGGIPVAVERIVALVDECLYSVSDHIFLCPVLLCALFARSRHGYEHEFSDAEGNFARLVLLIFVVIKALL